MVIYVILYMYIIVYIYICYITVNCQRVVVVMKVAFSLMCFQCFSYSWDPCNTREWGLVAWLCLAGVGYWDGMFKQFKSKE